MVMDRYSVVKVTVKTGCDLCQEVVKSNLPKAKAQALRDKLEETLGDFNPQEVVSYLIQRSGSPLGLQPSA
jgi:hypothetical protein